MKTSVVLTRPELLKSSKIGAFELKAAMKVNTIKGFLLTNATAITLALAFIISGIIAERSNALTDGTFVTSTEIGVYDIGENIPDEPIIINQGLNEITQVMTEMIIGNPIPIPESEIAEVNFADYENIDVSLSSNDGKLISGELIDKYTDENNNSLSVGNEVEITSSNKIPEEFGDITYEVGPEVDMKSLNESIVYPDLAIKANMEGKVLVSVLLDERGKPLQVNIRQSSSSIFNEEAVRAVKNAIFTPAFQNKVPVKSWISIPISFKLK